jgi:hypothetical protein
MRIFKILLKAIGACLALLISIAVLPSAVYAQKYEVHPYAGVFCPSLMELLAISEAKEFTV